MVATPMLPVCAVRAVSPRTANSSVEHTDNYNKDENGGYHPAGSQMMPAVIQIWAYLYSDSSTRWWETSSACSLAKQLTLWASAKVTNSCIALEDHHNDFNLDGNIEIIW